MITLGLVTVGALVGFAVLIRKWRNGVPSIVLPALPLALLFLVAPIPPAIFHMIRGFQQISERGDAGIVVVAGYALEIDRSLFWGSIAFVVVMIAAGTLQWNAKHDETEITDTALEPVAPNQPPSVVEKILLVGSSLLALPAFALMRLTGGIPRLVMSAAMQLDPAARSMTPVAPSDLANTSTLISSQLVSAMLFGIPLSLLLGLAAVGSLVAVRSRKPPRPLSVYSWLVLAVCLMLAAWNAIQLNADMQSFELARSRPAQ